MRAAILFLLLILCSSLSNCKKDDPVPGDNPPAQSYYLKQATKDYCYFKPGSWWLYQDSLTGIKDSVYVTYAKLSFDTIENQSNAGIYEWFWVTTEGTYLNNKQYVYLNSSFSTYSQRDDVQYKRMKLISPPFTGGAESYFSTNFQTGFTVGSAPGTLTCLGYQSSLVVGDSLYKNVVSFYNNNNGSEHNAESYMYFAKNLGMIKKVIPDSNSTWILINYNIVQ